MQIKTNDYFGFQTPDVNKNNISQEETDPFRRLIRDWLLAGRANGLSERTLVDYRDKVFKFWWWWTAGTGYAKTAGAGPERVTVKHAREYVAYLRTPQTARWGITKSNNNRSQPTLSPVSVNSYGRAVKVFFNWLAQEGEIEDTPFKKSVKFGTKGRQGVIVKRLGNDELNKLFDYLLDPARLDTFLGRRDLAILAILLDSGIRRGELLSLRTCDVDLERGRLLVRGKTGERWAMFRSECAQALRAYIVLREKYNRENREELWLMQHDGDPLSYYGFGSLIRRIETHSGVNFHAHQLRHTFASLMAEAGIDPFALKGLLGHTSITTTQIYVQNSPESLSEAHRTRSPLAQLEVGRRMRRKPGRPKRED